MKTISRKRFVDLVRREFLFFREKHNLRKCEITFDFSRERGIVAKVNGKETIMHYPVMNSLRRTELVWAKTHFPDLGVESFDELDLFLSTRGIL